MENMGCELGIPISRRRRERRRMTVMPTQPWTQRMAMMTPREPRRHKRIRPRIFIPVALHWIGGRPPRPPPPGAAPRWVGGLVDKKAPSKLSGGGCLALLDA